ncbi:hypothetical protein ABQF26_03910 [Mycolicibacterium elephantis]
MTVPSNSLVFDTGPLRHFAVQSWLGVLKFIAGPNPVYIPDSVEIELNVAAEEIPAVRSVLGAEWITVHRSSDLEFAMAFSRYEDRLVAGGKNRGECGVLAMGELYGCEIVVDDAVARTIAEEKGIRVTCTVALLCRAVQEKKITVQMVEALADDLIQGEYYLPFGPGGFRNHALEQGWLDYDEMQLKQ